MMMTNTCALAPAWHTALTIIAAHRTRSHAQNAEVGFSVFPVLESAEQGRAGQSRAEYLSPIVESSEIQRGARAADVHRG